MIISIIDLIRKKRDGNELTTDEIFRFVEGVVLDIIPDYQLSAFLMAIYFAGMTPRETANLTAAMAVSGDQLQLDQISLPKIDKHSTGGVGDKVSLILAPIVAACGAAIPMISGRGLGHTGGTVDKLESIPSFRTDLTLLEIAKMVEEIGVAMAAQTERLTPADRKLYALRDVTGTVESLPLITASILSKKFAEDLDALVMDVKVGHGAFMKTLDDARALASSIQSVAMANGLRCQTLITRMDAPLGKRIGNWLEVCEVVRILKGDEEPPLIFDVTMELTASCLTVAGISSTHAEGLAKAKAAIADGRAYQKFLEIVEYQQGDVHAVESAIEPQPTEIIHSNCSGWLTGIDALKLGLASIEAGAGRRTITDTIAPEAGIILYHHIDDYVERGEPLCGIVIRRKDAAINPEELRLAFQISDSSSPQSPPVIELQDSPLSAVTIP